MIDPKTRKVIIAERKILFIISSRFFINTPLIETAKIRKN